MAFRQPVSSLDDKNLYSCKSTPIRYPGFISLYELEKEILQGCGHYVMKDKRIIGCKNKGDIQRYIDCLSKLEQQLSRDTR